MYTKPRAWYSLFIAVLIFLFAGSGLAAENMIRNGNMELGEGNPANWGLWGWQMKNAIFKLETGAAHSGSRFATIINNDNNDARFIQEVLVETGKKYKISGWIKTENVGTGEGVKGASICLLEEESNSTLDIKGSNGKWEYVEFYLEIGRDIKKVTISLAVGGLRRINTGKASFDDVAMEEVTSVPTEAKFSKYELEVSETSATASDQPPASFEAEESEQPAPKQPWYTNPLIIVVLILVAVIVAALVILFFSPKEKENINSETDKNS